MIGQCGHASSIPVDAVAVADVKKSFILATNRLVDDDFGVSTDTSL